MSDQLHTDLKIAITTTARELRALLGVVQRAPMSDLEALQVEAIFDRWLTESNNQHQQARALAAFASAATRARPENVTTDRPILYPHAPDQPQQESPPIALGGLVSDQPS